MRRYDPRRIAPAATQRVEPQRPAMRKTATAAPAPKSIDEINALFHSASRGAKARVPMFLHRLEQDEAAARRRLR